MEGTIAAPEDPYYANIEATERALEERLRPALVETGHSDEKLLVGLDGNRYVRVSLFDEAYFRKRGRVRTLAVLPPGPIDRVDAEMPVAFPEEQIGKLRDQSVRSVAHLLELVIRLEYDERTAPPTVGERIGALMTSVRSFFRAWLEHERQILRR